MSQTSPSPASAGGPAPPPADVLVAWPRTAQWAMAFLLVLALLLIALSSLGSMRWGARPTRLGREAALTGRVDLNRADRAQLLQLPDVGEKLAENIELYRRASGGFRSVDELKNVPGIGAVRLRNLRPWVYVEAEESDAADAEAPPVRPVAMKGKGTLTNTPSKKAEGLTGRVDINRASQEQLQQLPGIGPEMARRIVETRRSAPFRTVNELRRVRGIGAKTLEKLRPYVTVGSTPERAA
jgi:competence protein ComEA